MKIAIVTDAWHPQINGVVRTLGHTGQHLQNLGHEVLFITPEKFLTYPCPTYPSIRLAVFPKKRVRRMLHEFRPQAVHIATEGPLGHAARALCLERSWPFTTSYHTQFPEYIRARFPIPTKRSYAYLPRYHGRAARNMVATRSMQRLLEARGFKKLQIWARGVDTGIFQPGPKSFVSGPRPISMYMGRVAVEKNIEAFLNLDVPGSKYVVGDGPDLERLRQQFPNVTFTGQKLGQELTAHLAAADVFVFPSLTDTFGLVLLEAMACGVPVAAYPVAGPLDVIGDAPVGCLHEDLGEAVRRALQVTPAAARAHAERYSWDASVAQFLANICPFPP